MLSNKLFLYDVKKTPRSPKLIRTVELDPTGYSGPHTMYAVPEGVLIAMLGAVGGGGPGALVLVDNNGKFKKAWPVVRPDGQPGYMYDVGVKPEMNRMITSSWAHPGHIKAGDHPAHSGKEVVVWDWKAKKILQVQEVDLAPLEVRWMHGPNGLGGFTNAAFGNSVWYWEDADKNGTLEFHKVIPLPDNSIPADMRVSYDNRYLYVSLWGGGKVQQYDIANPKSPKLVSEVAIPKPNMMKLTPDSRRLYVTNSLLSSLDGDVQLRRLAARCRSVGDEDRRALQAGLHELPERSGRRARHAVAVMLRATVRAMIQRELAGVRRTVEAYPDDASVWATMPGLPNAGGTLVLHIAGNLQHYLGAVLGSELAIAGIAARNSRAAMFLARSCWPSSTRPQHAVARGIDAISDDALDHAVSGGSRRAHGADR